MSQRDGEPNARVVHAEEFVATLAQGLNEPEYTLRGVKVAGKLDLKHRIIDVPVEIQDCEFLDEVDLRYCEFTQTVNFSGCTFHRKVNSGDRVESRTIYRKDLICNRSVFHGGMSLHGVRIEGSASFLGADFANVEEVIDFEWASIGGNLACDMVRFRGPANFGGLKCGGVVAFYDAHFAGAVNFPSASVSADLYCNNALFEGPASFQGVKCGGAGLFSDSRFTFEQTVDFRGASFGGDLYCENINFENAANFNLLKCGGVGVFQDASFTGEANFESASFGADLYCDGAQFRGPVTFNSLQCGRSGFFHYISCLDTSPVDFASASFGADLYCDGAQFQGAVTFNSLQCGGVASFPKADFRSDETTNFSYASFGNHLLFQNADFAGSVRLDAAHVSQALVLTGARFQQSVSLNSARAAILVLEDEFPFELQVALDLRGFTFEKYIGVREGARRFVQAQDPTAFSMDPYLQLEQYYRSSGDDVEANRTYYAGRHAFRENAKMVYGSTRWSKDRMLRDWVLKWFTGYGVKPFRVFLPLFALLWIGVLVFWPDDALKINNAPTPTGSGELSTIATLPSEEQSLSVFMQKLGTRLAFSGDLLMPTISFQGVSLFEVEASEKPEPQGALPEAYAPAHQLAGQLLILLFVATLLGYTRRW
jgi:hypothetical protein